MYICLECDAKFEKPMYYRETHGLDTPPYEEFEACPCCGGAFAETYECDCCGKWITGEYIETDDGYRYCDKCYHFKCIGDNN